MLETNRKENIKPRLNGKMTLSPAPKGGCRREAS